jgi:hypothetical protein
LWYFRSYINRTHRRKGGHSPQNLQWRLNNTISEKASKLGL